MRKNIFILFSILTINVSGQSFLSYKDTTNNFSINIPDGWKYGVNKSYPTIKLIAYKTPIDKMDTSRHNFNINITETSIKDLNKAFEEFLDAIKEAKNFSILGQGDTVINKVKFKYVIETHRNGNEDIQMHNYDLITVKDQKTYVLTMVTFSNYYKSVKPLFDQIASSFSLLK